MPPQVFHPVLRTVEIVAKAQRGGERRENVYHYNYGAATPSEANLQDLLSDLDNVLYGATGQPSVTCSGTTWFELTARDIDHEGAAYATRTISKQGIDNNSCMPGNVALCLTKRTGISSRFARGRFYLFDLPESMFDDSSLNIAFLPRLTIIANHLLASRIGGQFKPAVASRTRQLSVLLTAITWDFTSDSQRRRLPGRGI